LQRTVQQGGKISDYFDILISDIEMPEMDGYMLTSALREDPAFADLYILLHSSINGEFNVKMVEKTGANQFIQKYDPNDLAQTVLQQIRA